MPRRSIWSARQRAALFDLPTDEAALLRHSKRLHVFEPRRVPKPLMGLTGNKSREDVIVRNWPDILRVAATLASGALPSSQLLRKFAAYPRQHELAVASAKSDGANVHSSSSTGCLTPICSAEPTPA